MKLKDKKPIIIAALQALGITPRELEITPDNYSDHAAPPSAPMSGNPFDEYG